MVSVDGERGFARETRESESIRILLVDDDAGARAALEALLQGEGFVTSTAADGEAALAEAKRAFPAAVLTDLQMPRMNGTQLCQRLHEIDPDLPVIVITAHVDMQSVVESLRAGAEDYLTKPLSADAVVWSVQRALDRRTAKREQAKLLRLLNEQLLLSSLRERERAEVEVLQRVQLNALLGNLSEGVAVVEPGGRIVVLNDAACSILGCSGELLTLNALHVLEARDLDGRQLEGKQRPLARALAGDQFVDYEIIRVRADGDIRRVVSAGTCVKDKDGHVVLAIVVFRDVTELRRLEVQRDEHLSLISHDLRNPLSALLMSIAVLKRSAQGTGAGQFPHAEHKNVLERAERNVKRMSSMLEELAETTYLESRGLTPQHRTCDLRDIAGSAVDGLDDNSARRITIETEPGATYLVLADAPRLERVIVNLLTNALKYSADADPVVMRLSRDTASAFVDVIDQGIGVGPESCGRLFDRYYRTRRGKESAQGLGLGLYISRLIAEAHGGTITVSSEPDEGSSFRLVMPLHPSTLSSTH